MGNASGACSNTCHDCSEPLHFMSEEDLDAHQLSVHWCLPCVQIDNQSEPFPNYGKKQNHIICACSSTSQLAGRTRGMSIYDSSTSSANMRKKFMPETFDGHHLAGITSDDLHSSLSTARMTFTESEEGLNHRYFFDVAVPGTEIRNYTSDDVSFYCLIVFCCCWVHVAVGES
jgi:hypothetical protein